MARARDHVIQRQETHMCIGGSRGGGVGAAIPGDVRIGGWVPGMQGSTPSIALAIGYGWGNPRVL